MKKLVSVLMLFSGVVLLVAACGGGGGGGGGDTIEICIQEWDHWLADTLNPPTSDNLVDTYDLDSFDLSMWIDGVLYTMDEGDIEAFSGTMDIQANTISQVITLKDYGYPPETVSVSGTYMNSPIDTTSGILTVTDSSGTHDVGYSISGNYLTTDSGKECEDIPAEYMAAGPLAEGPVYGLGIIPGKILSR